jgi:MoxR-like ATPase
VMKCAQALALFDGGDFVTPEHVQEIAAPVIAHRLVMDPQARYSGHDAASVVAKVIDRVPVPA